MRTSKIEWTDFTVNAWEGCQKVGPGCDNCYAEDRNNRFSGGANWGPGAPRRKVKNGLPKLAKINREASSFRDETGHWPRVFCSSLSDVFDNAVHYAWRYEFMAAMTEAIDTRIQILTKRVGNVEKMMLPEWRQVWPSHVGLMITVVNQPEADRDIPRLLHLKHKYGIPWVGLSIEPMLGPVDLTSLCNGHWFLNALRGLEYHDNPDGIPTMRSVSPGPNPKPGDRAARVDWVICGGESGRRARPVFVDWVRSIRDQCAQAGVPFLFKQWGEFQPRDRCLPSMVEDVVVWPDGHVGDGNANDNGGGGWPCLRVGKGAAGNMLDGQQHLEFPEALK